MKYLPIAQFIVLVLILITLNGNLIASGIAMVTKMFEAPVTATKSVPPGKRKRA